jgi:alpha-ketoglutarate-dependent taurine dioxygenase
MAGVQMRALHPSLGAEVLGLEPSVPLDDGTLRELRAAFDERSVLVFRDLDIDEDFQRYLVFMLIGEPAPGPEDVAEKGGPMLVSNKEENAAAPYGRLLFHCDNMWARTHQYAISLYGVEVEPPTAPTQFVSNADAWDRLPDELRARVATLEARHGFDHTYPNRGADDDVIDSYFDVSRSSVRPVVYRHPRTGRTLLYVSQQATIEILGLTAEENEALLAELFSYLYEPRHVLEHEWRTGDLVIWDNVAAQHGRNTVQLQGPVRTLRKVTGPMNLDPDEVLLPFYSKVDARPNPMDDE